MSDYVLKIYDEELLSFSYDPEKVFNSIIIHDVNESRRISAIHYLSEPKRFAFFYMRRNY